MNTYSPIKNPSFVGREYYEDDEVVESRDRLYYDFGGDNYVITRNALYLGLMRGNDGYEPSLEVNTNEERICDENEDKVYMTEAELFAALRQKECRKEVDRLMAEADQLVEETEREFTIAERMRKRNKLAEPEMVEKCETRHRFLGRSVQNTFRPSVRRKGGRPLGNHGSYGGIGIDYAFRELRPVEALVPAGDGKTYRRVRVS